MKTNEKNTILDYGNRLARITDNIIEQRDVFLSDLAQLETIASQLRQMVEARPQIDPDRDNCSKPWEDYVLPDDPRAFFWKDKNAEAKDND